jgi:HSP20 family protein
MRWSPETGLGRGQMDRFFHDMLREFWGDASQGGRAWSPAVDIQETADALVLTAELPGLSAEQVDVSVENQVLTLSGERKFERDAKGETLHRVERAYGAFSRSFTLPTSVAVDRVEARFENGLLTVTLPKQETAKSRKIAIK